MKLVKVLAISGSLRLDSLNTKLLRALIRLAPDMAIALHRGIGELPLYNADLDGEEPPEVVAHLRSQVAHAKAVILSSPEYAHGIPGAFKNALDWVVSSGEFVDKPVLLINVASTGGERAQAQTLQVLKVMTANVVQAKCFTSAKVRKGLDEEGSIQDRDLEEELRSLLSGLL